MDKSRTEREFSVVFVPTWSCNARCAYCFQERRPPELKVEDWPAIFRWVREFAEAKQVAKLRVHWQGGEVLTLGKKTLDRGLRQAREIFADSSVRVGHHLQTNLLLYDSSWKDLIREHFTGNISSSLDYPNLYRVTPALGPEAYTQRWLERRAMAEADGFDVSAIALTNHATLELGAERFFRYYNEEIALERLQINSHIPGRDGDVIGRLDRGKLARFMVDLYRLWRKSGRKMHLSPLESFENRIHAGGSRLTCIHAFNCGGSIISIGPDGSLSQCDCWSGVDCDLGFGMLRDRSPADVIRLCETNVFAERPVRLTLDEPCGECRFWRICHGGCPIRAQVYSGSVNKRDDYCGVYRDLFEAISKWGDADYEETGVSPVAVTPGGERNGSARNGRFA